MNTDLKERKETLAKQFDANIEAIKLHQQEVARLTQENVAFQAQYKLLEELEQIPQKVADNIIQNAPRKKRK